MHTWNCQTFSELLLSYNVIDILSHALDVLYETEYKKQQELLVNSNQHAHEILLQMNTSDGSNTDSHSSFQLNNKANTKHGQLFSRQECKTKLISHLNNSLKSCEDVFSQLLSMICAYTPLFSHEQVDVSIWGNIMAECFHGKC